MEDPIKLEAVDTPQPRPARMARVALVNVPFAGIERSSISCGLLKAVPARARHGVRVRYLNLELAAEFGADRYRGISSMRTDQLAGEWLFRYAAFGGDTEDGAHRAVRPGIDESCAQFGWSFKDACRLRHAMMPAMVEHWLDSEQRGAFDVPSLSWRTAAPRAAAALSNEPERNPLAQNMSVA